MQIHHIDHKASGGTGEYDNGVPVCLDCHAEVESHSNMGRSFTANELRLHRDRWFRIVRERPDVLIRAASRQTQTGPLEALLAELEFNRFAVDPRQPSHPPLATKQFDRTIATNALSALDGETRERLQRLYVLVRRANYHFDELMHMSRTRTPLGDPFQATQNARNDLVREVALQLPETIHMLEQALSIRRDKDAPSRDF